MNYEQLRTYFTWRTQVRAGNITQTDLSYVFLYVYELINNIGVQSSGDGINKLLEIWSAYRCFTDKLDKYMAGWLRDYYIINSCPFPFEEILEKEPLLQAYYPSSSVRYTFDFYEGLSSYKIKHSVFYTAENEKLIMDCFSHIVNRLDELTNSSKVKFNDTIFDRGTENRWQPFKNAIFFMKSEYLPKDDKTVKITDDYKYFYKNGKWTYTENREVSANGRRVIGYILKRMEQLLRRASKFKYKLNADDRDIDRQLLDRLLPDIGFTGFLTEIDTAVNEFYINLKKTIIKVDEGSLEKIRQNALITQEKLIVSESVSYASDAELNNKPPPILDIKPPAVDFMFQEAASDPEGSEPQDMWRSLAASLEPVEAKAVINVLNGASAEQCWNMQEKAALCLRCCLTISIKRPLKLQATP